MDKRTIDKLLVGIQNGSNDDFATLYKETKRGVFSFLYTYYKDYYMTEDAMESVYLKIKLNISKYSSGSNGLAWILEIAKNFALNELKSKRFDTDELPETVAAEESADSELIITDLINRTLSEEDARILTLHIIFGYKHREIGKILGLPTGTVTSRYKRACEKVKIAWLDSQEGGER